MGRNRGKLATGAVIILSLLWVYHRAVTFRSASQLAAPVSRAVLRRLAAHRREYPDNPYLSITHLRDELLESLPATERSAVWDRVKKLVEGNSNVRAGGDSHHHTGVQPGRRQRSGHREVPGKTRVSCRVARGGSVSTRRRPKVDDVRPGVSASRAARETRKLV